MNRPKLFTVVIPNYNRITELKRAIQSIRDQIDYDVLVDKIIIVDDESENIKEIEQAISLLNDSKVILIKNEFKSNAAFTRNQGARLAKSPWVCFLDSDDAFESNKLLLLSERVNSNADVYYNKALVYFDGMVEDVVPHRPLQVMEHISDYLFVDGEYMQTSMLTVKREFFDKHGFNDKYIRHQDYDLCLSFNEHNLKIEFVDSVGTLIYWSSKERPNNKGESFDYSRAWLEENKNRITESAYKKFYFNFIIMKSARNGNKAYSLSNFFKLKEKDIGIKNAFIYAAILIIPSSLQHWFYIQYKRAKINAVKNRSY